MVTAAAWSSVSPARQGDGQAGVAGDERAPAAVGGEAADMVADLVVGDVRPDRGDHAGEVDAQLGQRAPRRWGSGRTRPARRRS